MRGPVIVDSNVLISALVSDAQSRKLIVELDERLVAPELIAEEVDRNVASIAPRSDIPTKTVDDFFQTLLSHLELVPTSEFESSLDRALSTMGPSGGNDAVFLALAMSLDGSIWSDDSDFQSQDSVPILTTTDVIRFYNERG